MTPEAAEIVICTCLHLITDRLEQAAAVAKAAQACAAVGHRERAVSMSHYTIGNDLQDG